MNFTDTLSPNHPLRKHPEKPWPYLVMVGYRKAGSRKIVKHRSFFIRASGHDKAMDGGIRIAREFGSLKIAGERLSPSRAVSARPLDLADRINLGGRSNA